MDREQLAEQIIKIDEPINGIADYDDYLSQQKANFINIMVRGRINELVFWFTMLENDIKDKIKE